MGEIRIGFVILTWNSENVIDKCLNSLTTLRAIEPLVIIVDNGSKDFTMDVIAKFEDKLQITTIHYDKNIGTTISRNSGLKMLFPIKPDYYCILDSDTRVNDDAFLKLVYEMEKNPQYGIIGPTMVTSSGVTQMSARSFPTLLEKIYKAIPIKVVQEKGESLEAQKPEDLNATSYLVDYLMSACWLIRPDVINKVGLLDENIFYAPEDAEYCIRVWKSGYQVAFCPKARIIHEWQRLSKKRYISRMNWEHIKGLVYMFKKHHYLFSVNNLKKTFENKEEK